MTDERADGLAISDMKEAGTAVMRTDSMDGGGMSIPPIADGMLGAGVTAGLLELSELPALPALPALPEPVGLLGAYWL